jgi:hypothetical protein
MRAEQHNAPERENRVLLKWTINLSRRVIVSVGAVEPFANLLAVLVRVVSPLFNLQSDVSCHGWFCFPARRLGGFKLFHS